MRFKFSFFAFVLLLPIMAFAQEAPAESTGIISWFAAHWVELLAAFGGLVAVAGIIARLTPTSKDDAVVGFIAKLLDNLSPGGINKGLTK